MRSVNPCKPCFRLPSWGARQISKCLGLKWSVRGTENIVQDTGCVILINHQSAVDLIGKTFLSIFHCSFPLFYLEKNDFATPKKEAEKK